MPAASDGMSWVHELRLVALADVPRSTYQSWENDGLLERPKNGAFTETHVVEAITIARLRAHLPLATTLNTITQLRADGELAQLTDWAREAQLDDVCDFVIEPEFGEVTICYDDAALVAAVRDPYGSRTAAVIPVGRALAKAVKGLRSHREHGPVPAKRTRGRPRVRAGEPASVTPLQGDG